MRYWSDEDIERLVERLSHHEAMHVHVHHHFDRPLTVLLGRHHPAVGALLTVGEAPAMGSTKINVDTVNEQATITFLDDHGDTDALPPAGVVATFNSDNPDALTIAPDPDNPLVGKITVVGEGVANVSVVLTDAEGHPLQTAGGVEWTTIEPTAVEVDPGAAVGAQLTVAEDPTPDVPTPDPGAPVVTEPVVTEPVVTEPQVGTFVGKVQGESYNDYVGRAQAAGQAIADQATWDALPVG